jgi:transposase InsO family protein
LNKIISIKELISIVEPETVLRWQRDIIKRLWTFKKNMKKRGRKPVDKNIQNLILRIKNENLLWGVKRIQGELVKLNIFLDTKTIRKIINKFRRDGKIKKSLHWKKFLKMQVDSIYAMDIFTVDTIFNKRFYVFFIISHKTREIVRFAVTENPVKEFVRQQLIEFEHKMKKKVYMIHDNAPIFFFDYLSYGIKEVRTSFQAPNMNAIPERFIGSVRREALDYYLILNRHQICNILTEYISYYNTIRPHQGIKQNVPKKYIPLKNGKILKKPILSGLHHHYYRKAA